MSKNLFLSFDTTDLSSLLYFFSSNSCSNFHLKLGTEFFYSNSSFGVNNLAPLVNKIFLDLKLHDIPNTVYKSILSLKTSCDKIDFLTVHASGGEKMIEMAKKAAGFETKILAVTVLTSLNTSVNKVFELAKIAENSGADGIICSGADVADVKKLGKFNNDFLFVTPGVRPSWFNVDQDYCDDQVRVVTPRQAFENGATHIVVGRPIFSASNPSLALQKILDEIS